MSNGSHPSTGRIGWLCAALLFGVLAGGGLAWSLINRHPASPSVVIYQMPTPSPAAAPAADDPADRTASVGRRRHRPVHPAGELPSVLQGDNFPGRETPAPGAELSAGLDGATAVETPNRTGTTNSRETVLVDGIALTQPPTPTPATATRDKPLYALTSPLVDDSLTLAIEGIQKYIREKFQLREDVWGGELIVREPRAIAHQLFKGNDYWFSMGSTSAGSAIRVRLYDSDGNPADTNYWQQEARDGSYAAAEIQCHATGTYFIVVSVEKTAEERIPWGMVYAYR